MAPEGTPETKSFYDSEGWRKLEDGNTVDGHLFGVKEEGPRRRAIYERSWSRIKDYMSSPPSGEVLEVGCGGSPERRILDLFDTYTGTDFSTQGLDIARQKFADAGEKARFVNADAVALPFEDNTFDTVYSAHMLYHILDRHAQAAALAEMVRVLRPGGSLVLTTANPRPLFFPARAVIRIVADTPGLNKMARKLKGPSPIPYNPAKLSWYKRQLRACSDLRIVNHSFASTHFNQNVTEYSGAGRVIWSFFDRCDGRFPNASAYLGNYVVVLARK